MEQGGAPSAVAAGGGGGAGRGELKRAALGIRETMCRGGSTVAADEAAVAEAAARAVEGRLEREKAPLLSVWVWEDGVGGREKGPAVGQLFDEYCLTNLI